MHVVHVEQQPAIRRLQGRERRSSRVGSSNAGTWVNSQNSQKSAGRRGLAQAEDVELPLGFPGRGSPIGEPGKSRDLVDVQVAVEDQSGRPRALSVPECSPDGSRG